MTVRNYRDKEVVFSQGIQLMFSSLHPERHGDAHGGLHSSQESFNRRPAAGYLFWRRLSGRTTQRIYTARSIGQFNINRLQKKSTIHTLKRDPQFATLFVEYLLSRVIRVEEDLVDQFFNFSEKRLARVPVAVWANNQRSKPEHPLKVSQATLAEMVGTTRARVSKLMSGFKKKGAQPSRAAAAEPALSGSARLSADFT
jgi:CRP/FNR family transcriptional regulator, cyclic AMP receptor protein